MYSYSDIFVSETKSIVQMKDKIIAALKTTYANLGLSDKAFGGVASILEKTVTKEEDITAAVAAPEISALVKAIQGETDSLRNKNTQISRELDDLKKQIPNQKHDDDPDPNDDKYAKLIARIDAMEKEQKEKASQEKLSARIAQIKEKLVSGGSKNENILGLVLGDAKLTEEETDDAAVERLKKSYDETYKRFYGNGPIPPTGGPEGTREDNPDKALIEALRRNGSLPSEENNQ